MPFPVLRFIPCALLLTVPVVASAQAPAPAHPSFAGTWVLDTARSEAGPLTPASASYTVLYHGDSIIVDRTTVSAGGVQSKALTILGADGKPWTNNVEVSGIPTVITSVVHWDQAALVMEHRGSVQDNDFVQTDVWTAAPDGKTLMVHRSTSVDGQDQGSVNLIFAKKSP